jgi:hypothetical protein
MVGEMTQNQTLAIIGLFNMRRFTHYILLPAQRNIRTWKCFLQWLRAAAKLS